MKHGLWHRVSQLTLKNIDGPWCWIFCVLARHCICYTTYQGSRLSYFPSPVQVYSCDSQIAPNHCPRSYSRHSRKRNRLSGNPYVWGLLSNLLNLIFRSMKRNTDDIGIFSSRLRFFLSSRSYFILFFCIFPYLLWELPLVWVRRVLTHLLNLLNDFCLRSRTCPFPSRS